MSQTPDTEIFVYKKMLYENPGEKRTEMREFTVHKMTANIELKRFLPPVQTPVFRDRVATIIYSVSCDLELHSSFKIVCMAISIALSLSTSVSVSVFF